MTFFSEDLSSIKKEDLIYVYHAIEHHCKGLKEEKKTAKTNKDKCLGLLVLFDHIDAIGKRGILRAIKSKSSEIPFLPKENENISRIKKLLEAYNKDEEIDEMKYKEMKESSIIEHLTYNLCVTFNIQNKVEYLLRSKIKKEIQKRLKFMEEYIRINLELLD